MIHLPTHVLTATPHSPAVCPACQARRLRFSWQIAGVCYFVCRECLRRFGHVDRYHAGGWQCGLEEVEDLPDIDAKHRFVQDYEPPFWPCFPPEALELSGITQKSWRRQSSTAEQSIQ